VRIVLDTNVIVSAFLSPGRVPHSVLALCLDGKVTCLYDDRILAEYQSVLSRSKFMIPAPELQAAVATLIYFGEETSGPFPKISLTDKTDEKFLEVAWAGMADALVTGNGKHFPARRAGLVKIMSPKEFLNQI
jgi:putative PIN family toxin of toxin-antitoxin system